jgi:hypothetical protein
MVGFLAAGLTGYFLVEMRAKRTKGSAEKRED